METREQKNKEMGSIKWITGLLGWVSGGPIGALLGLLIGSVADLGIDAARQLTSGNESQAKGYYRNAYDNPNGNYNSQNSYSSQTHQTGNASYREQQRGSASYQEQQRNSFLVSLLVLSSAVIKADGKVAQTELAYVREFIRRNFGFIAENEAMRILNELNYKNVDIYSVGRQIASNMNYSQRLQLFHYLTELANADGDLCEQEKTVLESIANAIGINYADTSSIIAMFYKSSDAAYKVLEISPNATNDEVKTAFRKMAMKNHPDKVATLGPDVQKAAAEKFRQIQEAYETIKKQRGMN